MQLAVMPQSQVAFHELEPFRVVNPLQTMKLSPEMLKVLHHIHENLFDAGLNVETLKFRCRIRDNNVSSRFRHVMGVTIKKYIESLRMQAAALLLQQRRRLGVFDVAHAVGYYHLQTFYNAFQRQYACTPASYRRRLRQRLDVETGSNTP